MKGKSIIILIILAIVLLPGVLSAKVDDSLILYLSFDEGDDKEAADASNYGNTGQLKGGAKSVAGKFGKAIWLDGIDDYVEMADSESLRVKESVTVMAWVNAERIEFPGAGYAGIIAKGNTYRSYSLYTHAATGGMHFSTSANVASTFNGSTTAAGKTLPLKTWAHVCAIAESGKSGGKHRYYINGEPAGETALPGQTTLPGDLDTAVVVIGKTQEGSRFFLGAIDEVRIWNRALSADEVVSQMNKGFNEFISVQPQKKLATTWGNIKY